MENINNTYKTLIIVDPQLDFIIGSLAVTGADKMIDRLCKHIDENFYDYIIVTKDWHNENHCSFIEQGGQWPKHCVEGSIGSDIPSNLEYIIELNENICYDKYGANNTIYLYKGETVEQYSAFESTDNINEVQDILDNSDIINICGIAGDFCVKHTVEDLIRLGYKNKLHLLDDCIVSINPDNCVVL